MLSTVPPRFDSGTFLAPGQKFEPTDQPGPGDELLTVSQLVRDRLGLLHVTMHTATGREISTFAEQVEFAVAEGHLVPVGVAAEQVLGQA
jgi:hypothetical protein